MKLPAKFDQFVARAIERISPENYSEPRKVIYHYTGQDPQMNFNDMLSRLYWRYFEKTPWFNADIIGRIYEGVQKIYVEQKAFATYVSAMMSGKSRAFYISPENLDGVKQIFGVQEHEEIILADSAESIKKLIKSLRKSKHKKVFFMMLSSPEILQVVAIELVKAGFAENKDFINAVNFLSDAQGVPLNAYSLVKLL